MSFADYLKSKQRFLLIWTIIHAFALFVNFFNIQGDLSSQNDSEDRKDYTTFKLFSTEYRSYAFETKPSKDFWPFVKFYSSEDSYNPYLQRQEDFSSFRGIFYQYDISEFLAYMLIILIIFYLKWQGNKTEPKREV